MIFEKPTDHEKQQWANSEVVERAEFGGHVYEMSADNILYVLTRISATPGHKIKVGYLQLVGVLTMPSEKLLSQVKQASTWRQG